MTIQCQQKLKISLRYENWFIYVKSKGNSRKKASLQNFAQNLELANLILILYNLNFISEQVYLDKYSEFIEKYTPYLEDMHNLNEI